MLTFILSPDVVYHGGGLLCEGGCQGHKAIPGPPIGYKHCDTTETVGCPCEPYKENPEPGLSQS